MHRYGLLIIQTQTFAIPSLLRRREAHYIAWRENGRINLDKANIGHITGLPARLQQINTYMRYATKRDSMLAISPHCLERKVRAPFIFKSNSLCSL